MNKSAMFLFAVSAATLGLAAPALAYDEDPVFPGDRPWYGGHNFGRGFTPTPLTPLYYIPSQRYYGNGYTVSYRYLPVYLYAGVPTSSSNFRTEAFHLGTNEIPAWGARSPRLTVKEPKAVRPPITSIIRKKSASQTPSKSPGEANSAAIAGDPPPTDNSAKP